jgi:hypothetical protein
MAIVKEYRCAAHGEFTATKPKCPRGCSPRFVTQEIRTAPAFRSGSTKVADTELRNLSRTYGLSDIPTVAEGESVMQQLRKKPNFAPTWGQVDHAEAGWSQREGEKPKTFALGPHGVQPGVSIDSVKPLFKPLADMTVNAAPPYRAPLPDA